jgi:hypothetical protein
MSEKSNGWLVQIGVSCENIRWIMSCDSSVTEVTGSGLDGRCFPLGCMVISLHDIMDNVNSYPASYHVSDGV